MPSNMAAILLRPTPLSQRAELLAVVVGDFPETPHQTRDNMDFPCLMRQSEARLRLACPPLARRNGAPHERGVGGEALAGRPSSRPTGRCRGQQSRGNGQADHSSHTGHDRYLEDRGLYPRRPTRGTSRLLPGRGFRAESIRSDSLIDASNHGHDGPPKSDSKRWV